MSCYAVLILLTLYGVLREERRDTVCGNYVISWHSRSSSSNHVKLADILEYHIYKPLGPPCLVQMMLEEDNLLSFTIQRNKTQMKRKKRGGERKFQIFGRSGCSSLLGGQRIRKKKKAAGSSSGILSFKAWKGLSY